MPQHSHHCRSTPTPLNEVHGCNSRLGARFMPGTPSPHDSAEHPGVILPLPRANRRPLSVPVFAEPAWSYLGHMSSWPPTLVDWGTLTPQLRDRDTVCVVHGLVDAERAPIGIPTCP